ncbi:MAG TPA: hypothetical protein VL381_00550 [Rhodocyclaceae bacterium]|jgi:hypothetical protein|nr:hypothetical protein [Rhodocyclaceae bacterium]
MVMKVAPSCALAALLALGGCAAASVKDLKADPAATIQFDSQLNYQRLYKNLLAKFNECVGSSTFILSNARVEHALYSDLHEADISYVMDNMNHNVYYHADIVGNKETSHVTAYIYFGAWKRVLDKTQAWAEDETSTCNGSAETPAKSSS